MRSEFWYAIIGMFLLVLLVPFVPFEIITLIELILFAVIGYFYWQDYREKEERLANLEAKVYSSQSKNRYQDENYRCGKCFWFGKTKCERHEQLLNARPCEKFYRSEMDFYS